MINVLQQVTTAHENIRARLSSKARYGIILLLAIIALILLIFEAEWLMQHMIALLPIVYVGAFLAIGLKRAIYGTILFVFFSFALWLRVGPPYDYVLGGEWVVFGGNDPWFHMRLVENLVSHFPQQISFDSYTYYPYGQELFFAPFFDWLLALIVWVVGLGHPSIELIEKIGAYFPAILGALVTIPVYFIGKELFNRNMGLIAAGLLAIAPGEFLFRSLLGFTDHHVAEVLFSTTAILFLILAIKRARETRPTFSHLKDKDWGTLKKPLLYSLLTGFTLGIYLLSWVGGLLFILIIFAYLVIQYIIDHLRGESTDYLCIIGTPMFLLSFIIFSPFWKDVLFAKDAMIALPIAIFTPIALSILSRLMSRYSLRKVYYPPAVILLALVAAGIFYLIDSSIFHSVLNRFIVFTPTVTTKTIMEGQPFFNDFTISNLLDHRIWDYFTTGFVTAPIAFLLLIYSAFSKAKVCKYILLGLGCLLLLTVIIDQVASVPWQLYLSEFIATLAIYAYLERNPARTLFIIWSAIILVAMLGQTRFAYYIAVNVALLSGYLLWRIPGWITQILVLIGWKEPDPEDTERSRAEKRRGKKKEDQPIFNYLKPKHVSGALSVIAVFFLAVYPTLFHPAPDTGGKAFDLKSSQTLVIAYHSYGPNEDWHEALEWLGENTPEPFEDPDFYYDLYEKPPSGETYDYPDSAYGIMSWWDYGHWITRIAHRIPNANPHQKGIGGPGPNGSIRPGASTFMTAQNEATANEIMDALDSRYVVIDVETAYGKYHTMVTWAGENVSDFYEFWYREPNGELRWYENPDSERSPELQLFYAPYYQSMCARLYNFGTEAVVPDNSTLAISFSEETTENGDRYKVLTGVANDGAPFATYEDAVEFIEDNPGYVIVGRSPFVSPIPLDALESYKPIHSSNSIVVQIDDNSISYVEIFEYTDYEK